MLVFGAKRGRCSQRRRQVAKRGSNLPYYHFYFGSQNPENSLSSRRNDKALLYLSLWLSSLLQLPIFTRHCPPGTSLKEDACSPYFDHRHQFFFSLCRIIIIFLKQLQRAKISVAVTLSKYALKIQIEFLEF